MACARPIHRGALGALALLFVAAGCEEAETSGTEPILDDERRTEAASDVPVSVHRAPAAIEDDPDAPAAAAVPTDTIAQLEALGYLPTLPTDNPEDRGVTVHDEDAAWEGLNLYSSRHRASAILMDNEGRVAHRWEAEDAERRKWMHVEPLPNGDILAISKDRDLARHAWDSSLIWRTRIPAHHDVALAEDGRLYALIRRRRTFEHEGEDVPVIADGVAILSPDGELERRVWLLDVLGDMVSRRRVDRVVERLRDEPAREVVRPGGIADLLHTNSIAFLHRDIPGVAPAGSVLLSFRTTSRVAILDAALEEVLWTWGAGELQAQHDATQLENGHLLIFDNGTRREESRAIEVDASTREIVWEHTHDGLFSRLRGGAPRLPNDNVLITEADSGRAVEVTREGRVVWEFWNPDVRHRGDDAERAIVYRLNRFPISFFEPL